MANQFSKGHVFVPNEVVDPDDLNNLVDLATALPALITDASHPGINATSGDKALLVRAGALHQSDVSTFPQGTTSIGVAVSPASVMSVTSDHGNPITALGTFTVGLKQQLPNKVLVAPLSGTTIGDIGARLLLPPDITPPTVAISSPSSVDFTLSNVFCYTLTTGSGLNTFHIVNPIEGQTVKVRIRQSPGGTERVNWAASIALVWVEGTQPVFTTTPSDYGTYVFTTVREIGVTKIHAYLESVGNVTNVSATATPADVFNISVANPSSNPAIALSLDTQAPNTFLAGPITGAVAVPDFRQITSTDTTLYSEVQNPTPHIVDCLAGNSFRKILAGTAGTETLHLVNGQLGQKISVYLIQSASPGTTDVAWTTDDAGGIIRWPGGTAPAMTHGIGRTDIVNFFCMGSGLYYGTFNQNFV